MRKNILGAVFAAIFILTVLSNAVLAKAVETSNEKWTETWEREWSVGQWRYHFSFVDRWNAHTTEFEDGTTQTVLHLMSRGTRTIYYYGQFYAAEDVKVQSTDVVNGHVGNEGVSIMNLSDWSKATTYYRPIQLQWVVNFANGEYRVDHYFVKV